MDNKIVQVICRVCGGKGGCYVRAKEWIDCGYCDGFGFHAQEEQDDTEQSLLLKYNLYRKQISELLLESIANVDSFDTFDAGKTITIHISPYNRNVFGEFTKFILKLAHYSTTIEIKLLQEFYYKKDGDKYSSKWVLVLKPDTLSDLEGFIDVLKYWDRG